MESSWPGSTLSIMYSGEFLSVAVNLLTPEDKYLFYIILIQSTVCREHDFEDGNHFYRFLEHEPFIPRCINFRGSTNDGEPKTAAAVGLRLTKILSAILESYTSDDRRHVDYIGISNSEEFRRYYYQSIDLICLYDLYYVFYSCYLYEWYTNGNL